MYFVLLIEVTYSLIFEVILDKMFKKVHDLLLIILKITYIGKFSERMG